MSDQTYRDPDLGKTAEQLFAERTKRLQDAMQLRQPDRIPIQLDMSYMLAEMYGVTRQEQHENADKESGDAGKGGPLFPTGQYHGSLQQPRGEPCGGRPDDKIPRPRRWTRTVPFSSSKENT